MTAIFLQGNAKTVLQGLPSDFVHCVVTSPPYFGLRRYEGGQEVWDGDENCQHEWGIEASPRPSRTSLDAVNSPKQTTMRGSSYNATGTQFCSLCGAWKGQLGGEPIPDLYIRHLVQIFREVRRVLRQDGVAWVNIGDSWNGGGSHHGNVNTGISNSKIRMDQERTTKIVGLKPMDMIMIPSLLALALRSDGWYLRSIAIWSKQNPMPESVNGWRWEKHKVKVNKSERGKESWPVGSSDTPQGDHKNGAIDGSAEYSDCPGCPKCSPNDGYVLRKGSWRPTDSYEQILMLTKTDNYFCDKEAVLEPIAQPTIGRGKVDFGGQKGRDYNPDEADPNFCNGSEQWGRTYDYTESNAGGGRNLRSVWTFPTKPGKFNHYAAYPPKLPEICIKASTSEKGCCPKCGSPYARVIEKYQTAHDGRTNNKAKDEAQHNHNRLALRKQHLREHGMEEAPAGDTLYWRPTCSCVAGDSVPCRVLDPFSGAGTTALVAEQLGLDSFSIDTSEEYIQLAKDRLADDEQKRIDEFIKQAQKKPSKKNFS